MKIHKKRKCGKWTINKKMKNVIYQVPIKGFILRNRYLNVKFRFSKTNPPPPHSTPSKEEERRKGERKTQGDKESGEERREGNNNRSIIQQQNLRILELGLNGTER